MNFLSPFRILHASFATTSQKFKRTNLAKTHRSSSVFTFSTKFPRQSTATKPTKRKKSKKFDHKEHLKVLKQKQDNHDLKFSLFKPQVPAKPQNLGLGVEDNKYLSQELKDALTNHFKFKNLVQIQYDALKKFRDSTDLIIASETGSGKTLSYLLPIFQELKSEENKSAESFSEKSENLDEINESISGILDDGSLIGMNAGLAGLRKPRQPRAIILVPSRELVVQITKVAKYLSHYCKLVVCGFHSKMDPKALKSNIEKPVDIMITTPGLLEKYISSRQFGFSKTKFVVLDEADTLFDDGFSKELKPVIESIQKSSENTKKNVKWTFVSATLPRRILKNISQKFPETDRIMTSGLHKPLPVQQFFLRIDSSTTKHNLLLETLKFEVFKEPRILIFCNTLKSCEQVTTFLKSKEYNAFNISSSTMIQERISIWDSFKKKGSVKDGCTIIVTTDLGSRGIDTLHCRSVIMFDFPQTTIDYIHRAGRVGRMGRQGKVVSFVGRRDRRLADKIHLAVRKRQLLTE